MSVRKRRKIRFVLLCIMLILCGIGLFFGSFDFYNSSIFIIKDVKIFAVDCIYLEDRSLNNTINSCLNHNIFYLDIIKLKRNLLLFPWVREVTIKRGWPNTLAVYIEWQQAIARWGNNLLIDKHGNIFYAPIKDKFTIQFPIIYGSKDNASKILQTYIQAYKLLSYVNLKIRIMEQCHEGHFWKITLDTNTIIYLKEQNPIKQIYILVKIYEKVITSNGNIIPKYFDLRYNNGLAIKWN